MMEVCTPISTPFDEAPEAFHPRLSQLSALADALCSPSLSLQQVAAQFGTTIDALSLYVTSPRGDDSLTTLAALDSALTVRLRLVALAALPAAAASLSAIVQSHAADEKARHQNRDAAPVAIDDIKLQERKRVNARKASSLLYRLATLHPRAHAATPRPTFDNPTSPDRDSSTSHSHRPATSPTTSPSPASASNFRSPPRASSTAERLDPLDPLDRINSPSPCGMLKRPLEHGSGSDIHPVLDQVPPVRRPCGATGVLDGTAPVPPVRRFGATGASSHIASDLACARHDHPRPCFPIHSEDGRGSSSHRLLNTMTIASKPAMIVAPQATDIAPPHMPPAVGFATARAKTLVALAGTTTSITNSAKMSPVATSARPASSRGPTGCSPAAGGEPALRGEHPRKAAPNHRTLKGSSSRAHTPASLTSGP